MESHENSPERQQSLEGVVVPGTPMSFKKHNNIETPSKPKDPVLLELEALQVGVDSVEETVHVPRNNPETPRAEPGESGRGMGVGRWRG